MSDLKTRLSKLESQQILKDCNGSVWFPQREKKPAPSYNPLAPQIKIRFFNGDGIAAPDYQDNPK